MIKKIFTLLVCLMVSPVFADTPVIQRVRLFSTTVDWSAVTGLTLNRYSIEFKGTNRDLIKNGLVLYYLDSFPCYGEADSVRIWISPIGKTDDRLRLICAHRPDSINFAWRNAKKDDVQSVTTGILTCPISEHGDVEIDIAKCVIGPEWSDYK